MITPVDDEITVDEAEEMAVLAGITAEHGLASDREKDAVRQADLAGRLAALLVRRQTNQHGCRPPCRHPDHARDVDYCREMLEMLGLPLEYPRVTAKERDEFVGSVATRLPRQGGRKASPSANRWNRSIN